MIPRLPLCLRAALGATALVAAASAQSKAERPRPYVVRNVRTSLEQDAPTRHLVLRDGLIEAVLDEDAAVPPGLWEIDGDGLLALPAFLDAYSHAGCDTPTPVAEQDRPVSERGNVFIDMREANRKGIQPAFRAADVLALDDKAAAAHRESGFALLLSAPAGELLAGRSVLASTRGAARRERILRGLVFDHAAFRASGDGYPSTLMGFHAQLRQFFLDAQRHAVLRQRLERSVPGARAPYDPELDAGLEVLSGSRRLVCEAETARDIRRWIRLAEELGLRIAISGGREAHKVADVLASRGIPVLLTLDWGEEVDDPDAKEEEQEPEKEEEKEGEPEEETDPDEPAPEDVQPPPTPPEGDPEPERLEEPTPEPGEEEDEPAPDEPAPDEPAPDEPGQETEIAPEETAPEEEEDPARWSYEEPLGVRREKRRRWVADRDCAKALAEAGVRFAFGTGAGKPGELLKKVRTLVKEGLPAEVARAALTRNAAELLGVSGAWGRLEPGYAASIALWTKDPTDSAARLRWVVVDGFPHELEVEDEAGENGQNGEQPAAGLDLSGRWEVAADEGPSDEPSVLTLTMAEDGAVTGTVSFQTPAGDQQEEPISGRLGGRHVALSATFHVSEMAIRWRLTGDFGRDIDAFNGEVTISGPGFESKSDFAARRLPQRAGMLRVGTLIERLGEHGIEAGAPLLPFRSWRASSPICGCGSHGGHVGRDDWTDDWTDDAGDDER